MLDEPRKSLCLYRLEKAAECLTAAEAAIESGSLPTAINRSYYCIFHAMRAVLSLNTYDSSKHSGIISFFRQHYIKTGIFSVEFSDIIERAFKTRNKSDYDDFYVFEKTEAQDQITDA
jgi:hypothetical protein